MKRQLIRKDVKVEKMLIFARFCPNCGKVIADINSIFLEERPNKKIIDKVPSLDLCAFCKHDLTSEELTDEKTWKRVEVAGLVCPVCDTVTPRTDSYAIKRKRNVFPCIQCGAFLYGGDSSSCDWDIAMKKYGCINCKLIYQDTFPA